MGYLFIFLTNVNKRYYDFFGEIQCQYVDPISNYLIVAIKTEKPHLDRMPAFI